MPGRYDLLDDYDAWLFAKDHGEEERCEECGMEESMCECKTV